MSGCRSAWNATMALACALLLACTAWADIATSKHNLSASGPGTVKAASEDQICVFCHAPHNSSPGAPLWNRQTPAATYLPYTSSTSKAAAGQPTRGSLLCLSCHDGTIALGQVLNRATPISMAAGVSTMPAGSASLLGTDLSGDHPISFAYTDSVNNSPTNTLKLPGDVLTTTLPVGNNLVNQTVDKAFLKSGNVQCTSCHDVHRSIGDSGLNSNKPINSPNHNPLLVAYGLAQDGYGSALCRSCHNK